MILSFHPCYDGDVNILCAGRAPGDEDLAAIRRAEAVVLPQGCRPALYRMARDHCTHVFPNYDTRFRYPGKTGQARMFAKMGVPHPRTWVFENMAHFTRSRAALDAAGFPLVFKLDWGGEGETVMLLRNSADLMQALARAAAHERSGQSGFVVQAFVPHAGRTLRVVVVGQTQVAYWRVQKDRSIFGTSLSNGASIDAVSDPDRRDTAVALARRFCQRVQIDLAGLDLLFDMSANATGEPQPLMLEINYFFGRRGLGGSDRFYDLLRTEIDHWLAARELAVCRPATTGGETP
jgi:ribosomal protein S6--L-glutamate ligase